MDTGVRVPEICPVYPTTICMNLSNANIDINIPKSKCHSKDDELDEQVACDQILLHGSAYIGHCQGGLDSMTDSSS